MNRQQFNSRNDIGQVIRFQKSGTTNSFDPSITFLKLIGKELVLEPQKQDFNPYQLVYGDDHAIARKVIEASNNPVEVLSML